MKYFLLPLMVGMCYSAASQTTFVVRANMNTGVGIQQNKLRNAYGIGGRVETSLKNLKPFKFIAGLDIGINGIQKMPYGLSYNGYITDMDVHYTSYLIQVSSGLKYILRENKKWTPYAALSAGALSYYTEMSIEDTRDPFGCSPVETKPVDFSMILAATAETGIRIKTRQHLNGSTSFIEAGVGYLAGTKGKYLRLEKTDGHDHSQDNYMVKFQQNSSGEVHEHSLGAKYKTRASQLIFHLAYTVSF